MFCPLTKLLSFAFTNKGAPSLQLDINILYRTDKFKIVIPLYKGSDFILLVPFYQIELMIFKLLVIHHAGNHRKLSSSQSFPVYHAVISLQLSQHCNKAFNKTDPYKTVDDWWSICLTIE